MRVTPVQAAFTSGEISPRLQARIDLDAYYDGAASLTNFVCLPHGPLLRRQGTTFISEAGSLDVRLIPFRFNVTQCLVIELGEKYARFYFKGGQVTKEGQPYQITTPWTAAQAKEVDFAQSGDIIYVVHPNVAPQKFSRLANDNWEIKSVEFTNKPEQWKDSNWPSHIVFHEQHLYYAATPEQPQTVWASTIGRFDDFTTKDAEDTVQDSNGFSYTIASDEVDGIKWLKAANVLMAGTSGAEYKIVAGSYTETITPKNIRILRQTSYGSADIRPQQIGNGIVFVQRGRNRVRMFEYSYADDQYVANDLTIMSEHILEGLVKETALQTVKDPYIWCVLDNGDLVGLTYEKAQKVSAWHKHQIAGGKVQSITIIPGAEADEIWLAVKRTINGAQKLYIEVLFDAFSEVEEPTDGTYLDSHLVYSGEATDSIKGLDHLEGQEVSILVDGWVHPNRVVKNGTVTLQSPGRTVYIGLAYESYFASCQIQSQESITMGYRKRIYSAEISLLKSLGMYIGVVGEGEEQVYFGPTPRMNTAAPLYTGTISVKIPASSNDEAQVYVRHNMPLPCEIRAIKYDMEVNQ